MGKTWGEQHKDRQKDRGTSGRLGARSAKQSKSGTLKPCRKCKGSGMHYRFKCVPCWGTGMVDA